MNISVCRANDSIDNAGPKTVTASGFGRPHSAFERRDIRMREIRGLMMKSFFGQWELLPMDSDIEKIVKKHN